LHFFFQAEDGIRDRNVTGVQTCALPISFGLHAKLMHSSEKCYCALRSGCRYLKRRYADNWTRLYYGKNTVVNPAKCHLFNDTKRSEERRVGKECKSRRSPAQQKQKRERT